MMTEKEKAEIVKWMRELGVVFVAFSPAAEITVSKKLGLISGE